jgi:hypothetical protein
VLAFPWCCLSPWSTGQPLFTVQGTTDAQIVDLQPKPYVPLREREFRQPRGHHVRPWMLRRNDETIAAWQHRTSHSCYRCGLYIADMRKLDTHEVSCRASAGDEGTAELDDDTGDSQ